MYEVCHKYPVMPGEPHLGSMTECELIIDIEEVAEILIDQIIGDGEVPYSVTGIDDYSEEDIEIDLEEWFDKSFLSELREWVDTDGQELEPDEFEKIVRKNVESQI